MQHTVWMSRDAELQRETFVLDSDLLDQVKRHLCQKSMFNTKDMKRNENFLICLKDVEQNFAF